MKTFELMENTTTKSQRKSGHMPTQCEMREKKTRKNVECLLGGRICSVLLIRMIFYCWNF